MCNGMYTEIAGDLVTERELARFLTLTGVPGIGSRIISLFQKCRRLCHPIITEVCCNSIGGHRSK